MGMRRSIGERHVEKVAAEIAPLLRKDERYFYRGLCFMVRASTGERVYRVYAYLTDQQFMIIEDGTRRRLVSHELDALIDVVRVTKG